MMLSDEKITHLTHILLRELVSKGLISLKDEESQIRKEIKRTIISELRIGEDIDSAVRKKLQSFSKKLIEGSPEWEILYKKFFDEERLKRGK